MNIVSSLRNPTLLQRYRVLIERFQGRGWEVPALPTGGLEAGNVIRSMVARLNNREPVIIREGKPVTYLDPAVARREDKTEI